MDKNVSDDATKDGQDGALLLALMRHGTACQRHLRNHAALLAVFGVALAMVTMWGRNPRRKALRVGKDCEHSPHLAGSTLRWLNTSIFIFGMCLAKDSRLSDWNPVIVGRSMDVTTGEPYLEPQGQGSVEIPPNYAAQTETPTDTTSTEQLAETAKQSAKQGVDQVKHTVMTQAASQKDQAAQSLHTVSGAVNQAAQQLRQNNQEPMARAAESAAANISQFADYLRSRDVSDIVDEVENFARRQPALFLSGAFLVGVLGARFLKSSRTGMRQPDTSQQWRGATSTDAGQYTPQPRSYRKPTYPNNRAPLNKRAPTLGE